MSKLVEACEEFRDLVLHQRGQFEEPCLDSDQTNAVLGAFDDTVGVELDRLKLVNQEADKCANDLPTAPEK